MFIVDEGVNPKPETVTNEPAGPEDGLRITDCVRLYVQVESGMLN